MRAAATQLYRLGIAVFFAGVVVQFFLAGLGVFRTQHDAGRFTHNFAEHRALGNVLLIVGIVVLVFAFLGRLGRERITIALWLPVLVLIQSILANAGPSWVRAIHPVVAIGIFALSGLLTHRAWAKRPAA